MDVQGYMPPPHHRPEDPQVLHYAQVNLTQNNNNTNKSHALPPLTSLPSHVASNTEQNCNGSVTSEGRSSSPYASSQPLKQRDTELSAIPAFVFDKRKSSPAVLGLPLGLNDEAQAQLSLHLSQQRNSIEAAMLLANFNRLPSTPAANSTAGDDDHDKKYQLSSTSTSSTRAIKTEEDGSDRSTFLQDLSASSSSSSSSSSLIHPHHIHPYQQPHHPTAKLMWVQGVSSPPMLPPPTSAAYPAPESITMIHPLSQSSSAPGQKHDQQLPQHPLHQHPGDANVSHPPLPPPHQHPHYYSYHPHPYMHHPGAPPHPSSSTPQSGAANTSSVPVPVTAAPPPPGQHPHYYYQHIGKLPLPIQMDGMIHAPLPGQFPPMPTGAVRTPTRRKKNRTEVDEDDMSTAVEPGDPDFPDMSLKDIEAARVDPDARPRRQKLRYVGDKYTPQWVRYNGQSKEGLCDTCQPGKWLQLKNSAFWYHKQFFHGISSVSGKEFMQPLETRWVDQDLVEGLCHQCRLWVSVSNVKRKNSVLWYRHAHKCHVYHKPKPNAPKRR
ncbi:hypothetical protein INT45_006518 [Circinella minor]|uniref:Transcription regulator Rua1 C-terminal domain-containing protein n=1 Tax=Circinella minor TaxID=1195481 RepID=A0A8H7VAR6_9FUNG|nr:hypothetical protein INT45_006518 [Circinella minor]